MDQARSAVRSFRYPLATALRIAFVVIGISPFLSRLLEGIPVLDRIGRGFSSWFAFQCHRDPERTLSLGALVMRPKLDTWPLRIWVGIASLFMILDVITELFALRPAWAPLRLF